MLSHDYILTSNERRKNVMDAKRVNFGLDSDHTAIKLKLRFVLNKSKRKFMQKKQNNKKIKINWKVLQCHEKTKLFSELVDKSLEEQLAVPSLYTKAEIVKTAILQAAKDICIFQDRPRDDWFSFKNENLTEKIATRNKYFIKWSKDKLEPNKKYLDQA